MGIFKEIWSLGIKHYSQDGCLAPVATFQRVPRHQSGTRTASAPALRYLSADTIALRNDLINPTKWNMCREKTFLRLQHIFRMTPLIWAVQNKHSKVAELLLAHPTLDVNAKDAFGKTPLIFSSKNGNENMTKILLENSKIDVNVKDDFGTNALIFASLNGHDKVVKVSS